MKKILLFDTSIATLNIGDEIINISIKRNWPELYKDNYIITFPTHTPSFHWWQNILIKKNKLYSSTNFKFLCGTNIMYTNMLRPEPAWNLFYHNTTIAKGTICLGVGIGVNSKNVTWYSKKLYNKVLSHDFIHSVRDEMTKKMLEKMGFLVWNTGCPTLWGFTPEFCKAIPSKKAKKAICTLTSYQADVKHDQLMIDILNRNYDEVYFWPQSFEDYNYLQSMEGIDNIKIVGPNLQAYDKILDSDIDYVGNRLHGGIFAMQHKCRSIIIAIDYRAVEMKKCYSFQCIKRENIREYLEQLINSEWETQIKGIDFDLIERWKKQFINK